MFLFVTLLFSVVTSGLCGALGSQSCRLASDPSVDYKCKNDKTDQSPCGTDVPSGSTVIPTCRDSFYSPAALTLMKCIDGSWDYVAKCEPDCGTIPSDKGGSLPWDAAVYNKKITLLQQICRGSLVKSNVIISAAHCFWNNLEGKQAPSSDYAVAVGEYYRPWNYTNDENAQKSDVKEVHIPDRFQGLDANYQDDLAIVVTTVPFTFNLHVRPVCLDFDVFLESQQLKDGNFGKISGFAINQSHKPGPVMKSANVPYLGITQCITQAPASFREFITSDKICVGVTDEATLCRGETGAGVAFPSTQKSTVRFYLRGVASTSPVTDNMCSINFVLLTQLSWHKRFIWRYLQPTNSL